MQTRSMPSGVLAGDRVVIKVFADNIPPHSASFLPHFVDLVLGFSLFFSLSARLYLSLSLTVVHLIMVLVCS